MRSAATALAPVQNEDTTDDSEMIASNNGVVVTAEAVGEDSVTAHSSTAIPRFERDGLMQKTKLKLRMSLMQANGYNSFVLKILFEKANCIHCNPLIQMENPKQLSVELLSLMSLISHY